MTGALGQRRGRPAASTRTGSRWRRCCCGGRGRQRRPGAVQPQFGGDDRHLVLLFEHGLGQGDGGPWRARFGHAADSPQDLLRGQLWWAIVHDMRARARLLAEHGADLRTPYAAPGGRPSGLRTSDGKTPAEVAALSGCTELVDWLVAPGSAAARPDQGRTR